MMIGQDVEDLLGGQSLFMSFKKPAEVGSWEVFLYAERRSRLNSGSGDLARGNWFGLLVQWRHLLGQLASEGANVLNVLIPLVERLSVIEGDFPVLGMTEQ